MATATTTPRPRAAKSAPARPVRDANFLPKQERKRIRKSMVRAAMTNWVAEKRIGAAERAQFYRELRFKKSRRIAIAKKMTHLAIAVDGLQQQVRRLEDRYPHRLGMKTVAEKQAVALIDEAIDNARAASGAVHAAAAEWDAFAKRKIYFTEAMA